MSVFHFDLGFNLVESDDSDEDLIYALDKFEESQVSAPERLSGSARQVSSTTDASDPPTCQNENKENEPLPETKNFKKRRFADCDEDSIQTLLQESTSKGTDKMTKWGAGLFIQWLNERGLPTEFEQLKTEDLDELLRKFYAELRNTNGEMYSKSTFVGIRASINRYIRSSPHNRNVNLMDTTDFFKSNQVFKSMLKKMKKDGLDRTEHHHPISEQDLLKLRSSDVLSTNSPVSLQRKVWFDLSLSFARRGRENTRELRNDAFDFKIDDTGCRYVQMKYHEATKNHSGDNLKDKDFERKARMYATGKTDCPVASFELYLSKRNQNSDHLFQQPRTKFDENDHVWYTTRPIGVHPLNNMMKTISQQAGLSQSYTNHCVRATTITLLAHAGVEAREIMRISGHKSEASLQSYNSDSSDNQKRQYSSVLNGISKSVQNEVQSESPCQSVQIPQQSVMYSSTNTAVYNQNLLQIQPPPMPVATYTKQFEINNSTVNVYNYSIQQ